MGKLLTGLWDSPKAQFDTLFKRDMDEKINPYQNLVKGGRGLGKKQKADYLARQEAKPTTNVNSPLTDRYS